MFKRSTFLCRQLRKRNIWQHGHPRTSQGIPEYSNLSKQWIARDGERWWLLDASQEQLVRTAKLASYYITGQNRPDFTPGILCGDNVVVVNCKDVVVIGDAWIRNVVTWQTSYPGGKYRVRLSEIYDRDPCLLMYMFVRKEVARLFRKPHVRLGPLEKLWLYEDAVHPHAEMCPRPILWSDKNPSPQPAKPPPYFARRWTGNPVLT